MKRREKIWMLFALFYSVINIAVPFLFLKDTGSFGGAFLFWNLLTGAVLLAGVWITSGWNETAVDSEVLK
ncbi:MAG: hypothetical protein Q7I97_03385 [Thermovirgaceae bacterium]|nr:hypothetical protein [Thermovirgaceae bacterium]